MNILRSSVNYLQRTAIVSDSSYKYSDILRSALQIATTIDNVFPRHPPTSQPLFPSKHAALHQPRIAIMCQPGPEYVAATLATWLRSGIAVPLALSYPDRELEYVINDSTCSAILTTDLYHERMQRLIASRNNDAVGSSTNDAVHVVHIDINNKENIGRHALNTTHDLKSAIHHRIQRQNTTTSPNNDDGSHGALIVYTSGTTGRPKGVLHTHDSLHAQILTLVNAWEWTSSDRILHCLPLHHVHGIINALYCPLFCGATVEFMDKFSPNRVWDRLSVDNRGENDICSKSDMSSKREASTSGIFNEKSPITVFMGVPTMYAYMLCCVDNDDDNKYNTGNTTSAGKEKDIESKISRQSAAKAAGTLRLTVSGSAACPLPVMHQWKNLTGEYLLERYGMTETGMLLGNPLHGERTPGCVGSPFEGVEVKIETSDKDGSSTNQSGMADSSSSFVHNTSPGRHEVSGELCVKSKQLFAGYWGRPEETKYSFDEDGFFMTGDTVAMISKSSKSDTVIDSTNTLTNDGGDVGKKYRYKILGRTSVDIIKCKGYKISALDVESVLLEHPDIKEIAVVGVPDEEQGEIVAAVVVRLHENRERDAFDEKIVRKWAQERLASYQVPSVFRVVDSIPKNAMGKVNKKHLLKEIFFTH